MRLLFVIYDNDSYLTYFPQGLAYLASACRNAGHEAFVYQQDIYHWPDSHLTDYLDSNDFDAVFVSVIGGYYQYRKLLSLSDAINRSAKRSKMHYLIGGHGPAAAPEFFLRKSGADAMGIGEGELTVIELLDYLEAGKDLSYVAGIAFIDAAGKFVQTAKRELIADIDEIAFPAYDLFEMNYYALFRMPNIKATERCIPIISARGCPFRCNFCYRLDKGYRVRSPQNILQEIALLKKDYNISYFAFDDELLMGSRRRTEEICDAFIASGMDFRWECNGRLNFADVDILEKMKKAGCVFINYGIESLDNDTLKVMHKGLTRNMIIRGVENTLQVGISPGLNIIYGNIDEPLSAIDDALEFLMKYDDHAQMRTLRPVTPYPGSELFDVAVERGFIRDVEDFYENAHVNSDLLAVNFTRHTEEEIYDALYRANTTLLNHYMDKQRDRMNATCYSLYKEKNTEFRGFRQT